MTIKINKDLRYLFGPVRDQGPRPTCLAFAASDTHAALRCPWEPLSCEYVFFHAQKRAGRTAREGATLVSMLAALRDDGQPLEAGRPYLVKLPADLTAWGPPSGVAPLYRRDGRPGTETVDAIIAELEQNR